jgi:hypothetical protein
LSSAGLVSISLDYKESRRRGRRGNWFRYRAVFVCQVFGLTNQLKTVVEYDPRADKSLVLPRVLGLAGILEKLAGLDSLRAEVVREIKTA